MCRVKTSYISTCLCPTPDTFIPWDRKLHKYCIKYNTAYFSSTFCLKSTLLTIKYVALNLESFAIFICSFFSLEFKNLCYISPLIFDYALHWIVLCHDPSPLKGHRWFTGTTEMQSCMNFMLLKMTRKS